jgi:glycosyltransferase involved in cell wall biosynthesis
MANSKTTARRIQHFYRREAEVIYPPVQIDRFQFQPEKDDFYLTVARLVSYKKIPLIVEAFNQLGKPLVVIGSGGDLKQIQHLAGATVQILGWQPDEIVRDYMARAKAFVYAAHEDFGIAPVEAQACGTPVIAYGIGGTAETVLNVAQFGEKGTGVLFRHQTVDAIVDAVQRFEAVRYQIHPEVVRSHASSFSPAIFQQRYQAFVLRCYQEFERNRLL